LGASFHFCWPSIFYLLQQKPINQSSQILLIGPNYWDPLVIFNVSPSELSQPHRGREARPAHSRPWGRRADGVTKSEKDLKRLDQHWNHVKSLLQSTCFPRVPIPREKAENRRETSSLGCFVENIS
jgi:hypothetical protein